MTPNPLAAAWPTAGDPVMLDVSMSITTNALTNRLRAEKKKFPGTWALDAAGEPTTIPPCSPRTHPARCCRRALDHGHKGYAFALLVEALTGGLAGHGRADAKEGWGASVFIQVLAPALFGGGEDSVAKRSMLPPHVVRRHRAWDSNAFASPARTASAAAPSSSSTVSKLYPSVLPSLAPWAEKFGLSLRLGEH